MKKCDSKCDSNCDSFKAKLWLRNKVFYYRVEIERENNKRRFKRVSLKTRNYYEAKEKIKMIDKNYNDIKREKSPKEVFFDVLRQKFTGLSEYEYSRLTYLEFQSSIRKNEIVFDSIDELLSLLEQAKSYYRSSLYCKEKELISVFSEVVHHRKFYCCMMNYDKPLGYNELKSRCEELEVENEELKAELKAKIMAIEEMSLALARVVNIPNVQTNVPTYKISEVIDIMINRKNISKKEIVKKCNALEKYLSFVDLTKDDLYSKFHQLEIISKISNKIKNNSSIKGDTKRRHMRYIKELLEIGHVLDSNAYPSSVYVGLSDIEGTKKAEKEIFVPFAKEELLKIFDPENDYLLSNPHVYISCLIALSTGARSNAATTLQYKDIVYTDGFWCINFIEDHKAKHYKTDASERIVPIHPQIIRAGLLDFIVKNKKNDNDFINPDALYESGEYNNHYVSRKIHSYFRKIGIFSSKDGKKCFHSFRKCVNLLMQKSGIIQPIINSIVGWEGKGTAEKFYSEYTLKELYDEMDKYDFDFLENNFQEIKKKFKKKGLM